MCPPSTPASACPVLLNGTSVKSSDDTHRVEEINSCELQGSCYAGMTPTEILGICLDILDQLLQVICWKIAADNDAGSDITEHRDSDKIFPLEVNRAEAQGNG